LFQFDVRTAEEFAAGHIPGFRHAAGGQLVQATDEYVGVRGARIILSDNDGVRAPMTASWLIQMGWRDVAILLDHNGEGESESGWPAEPLPPLPAVSTVTTDELAQGKTLVLDLALSPDFAKAHIPGAWFAVRAQFLSSAAKLPEADRIVLTSPDGILATFAAADAQRAFGLPVAVLKGGTQTWRAQGRPLETGIEKALTPADDVYKRPYEGTDNATEAMEAYIAWELELVAQLERDGTCNFKLL
jgi:rhodanese-related sulfurtransferase